MADGMGEISWSTTAFHVFPARDVLGRNDLTCRKQLEAEIAENARALCTSRMDGWYERTRAQNSEKLLKR